MRDKARIKTLLAAIEAYWAAHPDLRLCQLLSNVAASYSGWLGGNDLYYMEDSDLQEALENKIKEDMKWK